MSLKTIIKNIFKPTKRKVVASVATLAILTGVASAMYNQSASAADNPNCDGNAVIYCGAFDMGTLQKDYNDNVANTHNTHGHTAPLQQIYSGSAPFSSTMTHAAMKDFATNYKTGYVTIGGNVYLSDGTLVATGAVTGGRDTFCSEDHWNGTILLVHHTVLSNSPSYKPLYTCLMVSSRLLF